MSRLLTLVEALLLRKHATETVKYNATHHAPQN